MINIDAIRWARKACDWADAPRVTSPSTIEAAEALPHIEIRTPHPMAHFAQEMPRFFVALLPGNRRVLVNTEGYTYARYIAALPDAPVAPAKGTSVTVLAEGLAAERSLIVTDYGAALSILANRVREAQERLADANPGVREIIHHHDAHNIGAALQDVTRLAGAYEEFRRFERLARKEGQ
jgi:hypothetical protein